MPEKDLMRQIMTALNTEVPPLVLATPNGVVKKIRTACGRPWPRWAAALQAAGIAVAPVREVLPHCEQGACGDLRGMPCMCGCRECRAAKQRERRRKEKGIKTIPVEAAVGRTVAKVRRGNTNGPYGKEPIITFFFTDQTCTTIVMPTNENN